MADDGGRLRLDSDGSMHAWALRPDSSSEQSKLTFTGTWLLLPPDSRSDILTVSNNSSITFYISISDGRGHPWLY